LRSEIARHRRIALDTSIFIYYFESNPRYVELADCVFKWTEDPGNRAVTSTLTMTEVLVGPYKAEDEQRADALFGLLSQYPHLEWIVPDLEIAEAAARIRGRHRLRTVDALQAATAMHSGATCLVGNDATFRRVAGLEILLLDDYV